MKHLFQVAAAMAVLLLNANPSGGTARRKTPVSAADTIRALEEERNQAILRGDVATLDRLTSDDYTFITLRGEMRSKAQVLKNFATGAAKYDSRTISDLKIRVYGTTAVVTGRSIQKGMENGKDYSGDYWFTRVYVKQHGRWRSVALQTTLIKG